MHKNELDYYHNLRIRFMADSKSTSSDKANFEIEKDKEKKKASGEAFSSGRSAEMENEAVSMEEVMLIKQQNDELSSKIVEFESLVKRQQAEFENYRKRTTKEKEDFQKYAIIPVIKDLLSVADNFERALKVEVSDDNKDFVQGFDMINKQLLNLFTEHGIIEVNSVGHAFDPSIHQAIQFEEKEDQEVEIVAEVYQKGYKLKDRIIRTATVKVYKPFASEQKQSEDKDEEMAEIEEDVKTSDVEKPSSELKEESNNEE